MKQLGLDAYFIFLRQGVLLPQKGNQLLNGQLKSKLSIRKNLNPTYKGLLRNRFLAPRTANAIRIKNILFEFFFKV